MTKWLVVYLVHSLLILNLINVNANNGLVHRRFEYKYSFKPPYLAQKDNTIPFFEYGGSEYWKTFLFNVIGISTESGFAEHENAYPVLEVTTYFQPIPAAFIENCPILRLQPQCLREIFHVIIFFRMSRTSKKVSRLSTVIALKCVVCTQNVTRARKLLLCY